ncbi:hypothetical protein HK405_006423, partial [Cladochytrium tenue]
MSFWEALPEYVRNLSDGYSTFTSSLVSVGGLQSWQVPYMHMNFHCCRVMFYRPELIVAFREAQRIWSVSRGGRRYQAGLVTDQRLSEAANPFLIVLESEPARVCRDAAAAFADVLQRVMRSNPDLNFILALVAFGIGSNGLMNIILSQLATAALQVSATVGGPWFPTAATEAAAAAAVAGGKHADAAARAAAEVAAAGTVALAATEEYVSACLADARVHLDATRGMGKNWYIMQRAVDELGGIIDAAEASSRRALVAVSARVAAATAAAEEARHVGVGLGAAVATEAELHVGPSGSAGDEDIQMRLE